MSLIFELWSLGFALYIAEPFSSAPGLDILYAVQPFLHQLVPELKFNGMGIL